MRIFWRWSLGDIALIALVFARLLSAQTPVYVQSSGPQAQVITGCTNATPSVCTTQNAHGLSASCSTSTPCYCFLGAVTMGAAAAAVQGIHECVYVNSTQFSVYTSPFDGTAGSPIAASGYWWPYYAPYVADQGLSFAEWWAPLTQFTIPSNPGPLGFFDGTNGDLMRRFATSTANGLSSVVVSGGSGSSCASVACTLTVNLSYNPTTLRIPIAAGNNFSITGTSGAALDDCGTGGGQFSYFTVASVTTSSVVSTGFTCAGLTTGTYTGHNMVCGPDSPADNGIGGTAQDCVVFSTMAHNNNPWWVAMLAQMSANNLTSSPAYKTYPDGGSVAPENDIEAYASTAALRFLVDRSNPLWLAEIIYYLNNDFRSYGVGYMYNSASWVLESNFPAGYQLDLMGLALMYAVAAHAPEGAYWTASQKSVFLNRIYNDIDDANVSPATTTNQDAAIQSNHNWVLSCGGQHGCSNTNGLASGTSGTTIQLPTTDAHYGTANYYNNTVIALNNGGGGNQYNGYTYGLITATTSGGALTVSSYTGGAVSPALNNLMSGTYTSGLTITGTAGQIVCLSIASGAAYATVALTSSGSASTSLISSGTALTIQYPGSGFSAGSPPTSAAPVASCSTVASVSGTATISTVVGTAYTILDTVVTNNTTPGATATYTWTKTNNLSSGSIVAGDEVMGSTGWGNLFYPGAQGCIVNSGGVGTNTVTCTNSAGGITASSTPTIAWRFPQWTTGDAGRLNMMKRANIRAFGVQPYLYGFPGGNSMNCSNGNQASCSGGNQWLINDAGLNGGGAPQDASMALDLAAAVDDPRAVYDLARIQTYLFNWALRWGAETGGRLADGPAYSWDLDSHTAERSIWMLTQTLPTYPNLGITGNWGNSWSDFDMQSTVPQTFSNTPYKAGWADSAGWGASNTNMGNAVLISMGWAFDPNFWWAPSGNAAAYHRNFLENVYSGSNLFSETEPAYQSMAVLHNSPNIADSSYSVLPLQRYFVNPTAATATPANFGWPHLFDTNMLFSRTCWFGAACSLALWDCANYTSSSKYDAPRVCNLSMEKGGATLLGSDNNPSNSENADDVSVLSDTFAFNGPTPQFNQFNIGLEGAQLEDIVFGAAAGIASGDSYGNYYGDQSSRYAGAWTNIAPNYNFANLSFTVDHCYEYFAHLKVSAHDEFVYHGHDCQIASGGTASMAYHIHFVQNGTAQNSFGGSVASGSTTLSGGVITSSQAGSGLNYGLKVQVGSPNAITVNDDCVGLGNSGQCSPSSTYSGGRGYTHRFTIAGGSSVGQAVNDYVDNTCMKAMQSLSDTTFAMTEIDADAHWTGCQMTGVRSTAIFLRSRPSGSTSTYSSITSFSPSFSGPGDYLIMGLSPGTYSVTVNGTQVVNAQVVQAGDNSLFFQSSGGGTVVVSQGSSVAASGSLSDGTNVKRGKVIIH